MPVVPAAVLSVAVVAVGPVLADTPDEPPALYEFAGYAAGDHLGASVTGLGDINGDSYDDVAIGSWLHDGAGEDAGRVDVISGRDRSVIYTFYGEAPGDAFGFGLAGPGDVNGDNVPDIAIGAHLHDAAGEDAGRVYLVSGADGRVIFIMDGQRAGDRFGRSIAPAGDLNHDDRMELIVGAHAADNNGKQDSGSASVLSYIDGGRVLWRFDGSHAQASFGRNVDGGHDVDNDGHPDLIVGEPQNREFFLKGGAAHVLSGATGQLLYSVYGDEEGERFGRAVCLMPDVNDDGHAEFIVGAPEHSSPGSRAGRATVYSGIDGSEMYTLEGEAAWDAFGKWIDHAGDYNGDGIEDFTVGARDSNANGKGSGRAYVFSGIDGETLLTATGQAAGDQLGHTVAGVGDINGDEACDVIFGADLADLNGIDSGAAYLYLGNPTPYRLNISNHVAGEIVTWSIRGAEPNSTNFVFYTPWGLGSSPVPELNVTLGLRQHMLIGPVTADADGNAELSVRMPHYARFFFVFYQAASYNNTTNLICRLVR